MLLCIPSEVSSYVAISIFSGLGLSEGCCGKHISQQAVRVSSFNRVRLGVVTYAL